MIMTLPQWWWERLHAGAGERVPGGWKLTKVEGKGLRGRWLHPDHGHCFQRCSSQRVRRSRRWRRPCRGWNQLPLPQAYVHRADRQQIVQKCFSHKRRGRHEKRIVHIRGLTVLGAAPHDDVRGRCLCAQVLLVNVITTDGFLEETECASRHAANVTTCVRRYDTQKALTGFFGEIRLLEETLGRVNVWQIERGAGVAGVEDGS